MQTGDKIAALVCDYLRASGYVKAFSALVEEARLDDVPHGKPSLSEILDEWTELRNLFDATRSSVSVDSSPPDLASVVGEERGAFADELVSSVSAKSAALCCTFDSENRLIWGEAGRVVHFHDREVALPDSSSGGILSLAVSGSLVIAGTMSGRLFVSSDAKEFEQLGTVHTKYVHRVCANSRFLVSASHDHTVFAWNLHTRQVLKQFKFSATCEALCFFLETQVLIGVRESNCLRLIDLEKCMEDEYEPVMFNLNAFGDDHVSFSVLDIAVFAGNNRLVAVASDRDRVFVYWLTEDPSSCKLLATLTGLCSDGLSAARCCFSPCGTILYSSSTDGNVCVFDLTRGGILVEKMKRHKNGVRDLAVSSDHKLATVSFDKMCIVTKINTL